ncbi:MAG: dihydrolipoamide acetyltransferase family protein [Planctomycetota bacterium]
MATEVRLPQLGQTMQEGTIVEYRVNVGDRVEKGDCIYEVETDKAAMEIESPATGFVKHLLVDVGQTLPVGKPILILAGKDEKVPQEFIESLKRENVDSVKTVSAAQRAPVPTLSSDELAAPTQPPQEIKLGQTVPLTTKQRITAERMLQSKREIPCFYLTVRADVTDLVQLRTQLNQSGEVKTSYHDFIMRALAAGLQKFPLMTGRLAGDTIDLADSIDIGLAITVPDGVVAPVVKNVDKKDLAQIARDTKTLIDKALNNRLMPADLEGGCITVSNLGPYGVESFIPIVIPGQCSILGVGRITDTCMPNDDRTSKPEEPHIVIRKSMSLTLSVDHRIVNGTCAAQFLDFVRKLLEDTSIFA